MKLTIIIGTIWVVLGIIDYIILAFDEWKKEGTTLEGEEVILVMICCLLMSPILTGFMIYIYIRDWWRKRK